MRVGIFDPYLDTLGGGEKYVLDIAKFLAQSNDVFIFWDDKQILKKAEERFSFDLSKLKLEKNIFKLPLLKKIKETREFDLLFYVSDGSIPTLFAKKNLLILQFPVNWISKNFISSLKLKKINGIICYSDFVKNFLSKSFNKKIIVLPPGVNSSFEKKKKENIILSVGRFTKAMNTKKQDFLIETFKKMNIKNWKLILIGSVLENDLDFLEEIKRKAEGYPVSIFENIPYLKLKEYYEKAKIYWHAAGQGEDIQKYPERAEHFGISTLEAMGAGEVPVVFNGGGQAEIVEDKKNGFLWNTEAELIEKTRNLTEHEDLLENMSKESMKRSKDFGYENFNSKLSTIIKNEI